MRIAFWLKETIASHLGIFGGCPSENFKNWLSLFERTQLKL